MSIFEACLCKIEKGTEEFFTEKETASRLFLANEQKSRRLVQQIDAVNADIERVRLELEADQQIPLGWKILKAVGFGCLVVGIVAATAAAIYFTGGLAIAVLCSMAITKATMSIATLLFLSIPCMAAGAGFGARALRDRMFFDYHGKNLQFVHLSNKFVALEEQKRACEVGNAAVIQQFQYRLAEIKARIELLFDDCCKAIHSDYRAEGWQAATDLCTRLDAGRVDVLNACTPSKSKKAVLRSGFGALSICHDKLNDFLFKLEAFSGDVNACLRGNCVFF